MNDGPKSPVNDGPKSLVNDGPKSLLDDARCCKLGLAATLSSRLRITSLSFARLSIAFVSLIIAILILSAPLISWGGIFSLISVPFADCAMKHWYRYGCNTTFFTSAIPRVCVRE